MSKRTILVVATGAIGCLMLVLCLGVLAAAGYVYYTLNLSTPAVDRIAYVDNNLNIQVVDARGEHRVALTTDASESTPRAYMFPTWSPDSQHVAFIGVSGERTQREGSINVSPALGGKSTTIFQDRSQFPFYLYWTPDSQRIGFLSQTENEAALMLGHAAGQEQARKLGSGSPFYWAWSPDSHSALLHVGGSSHDSKDAHLALLQWEEGKEAQPLPDKPAAFQAPQFSPNGSSILYASTDSSGQDELFIADARGAHPKSVMSYTGTVAFTWAPDGKKIAAMVTPEDAELPMYGPVSVFDADGSNRKDIISDKTLAFYWSPDGKQIAYLALVLPGGQGLNCSDCTHVRSLNAPLRQQSQIKLIWRAVSVADGLARTIATFTPTDNFISILPFFDQYARSLTFWSPDSKHFVYTQAESDTDGSVWTADLVGDAQPRKVGDGTLAVWSWK